MLKDLRVQISAMAEFDEQNEFYGRMQDLFGSPGSGSSVGVAIADLETRMQALSVSPENYSLMTEITSRAELIALKAAIPISRNRRRVSECRTAIPPSAQGPN